MLKQVGALAALAFLTACSGAQVTRTSANTMVIDANAAPICKATGAARVANKSAAIETLKAGYERYVITGGSSQNNVSVTTLPGSYKTTGALAYGGGRGVYASTTTYSPGPTFVHGTHDRSLTVIMFNKGDPGYEQGIDAKEALGPEWQDQIKSGVQTCL